MIAVRTETRTVLYRKPRRRGKTRRMIRAALKPGRVKYAMAGRAHREAVTRAAKAGPILTKFDLRVLMAVTALTTAYSKRSDRMAVSQVAGYVFGIEPDRVTGRQRDRVTESLRRLHTTGVLEYEPGRGRGAVALIGFPEPPEEIHPNDGGVSDSETHHEPDRNTPKFEEKHTQTGRHTQKTSEQSSESGSLGKKDAPPEDVAGFFDVVREHVGIELEPTRVLVDEIRIAMDRGPYSARHVGGEVDARSWPDEFRSSPEAITIYRLRNLR